MHFFFKWLGGPRFQKKAAIELPRPGRSIVSDARKKILR
jgi:hypothetical protein